MMKRTLVAVIALALAGAVAACATAEAPVATQAVPMEPVATVAVAPTVEAMATTATGSGVGTSGNAITATLTSYEIIPGSTTFAPGRYTLSATNQATEAHELVLLKTDLAPDALPYDATQKTVIEDQVTKVTEVEDVQPGTTKAGTESFDLAPGKYVLICNLAEHYKKGMYAVIEVK
jgi:uncharacterized cupredoxin-like copper-binding protein